MRDERREFLAEGMQAVREALHRPGVVRELFVTAAAEQRHAGLLTPARAAGVPVAAVTDAAAEALSETVTPQGLVARCRYVDVTLAGATVAGPRLVAVLDAVSDPGNAGTVLRTADAAGADVVVFTAGSVDPYNGKSVRASAGSVFHPALVRAAALDETLDALRASGLRVLAAAGDGDSDLDAELDRGGLAGPTAWIFGNEAHGLSAVAAGKADTVVRIPMYGPAESLNLAAAAAVCLYSSARAHRYGRAAR